MTTMSFTVTLNDSEYLTLRRELGDLIDQIPDEAPDGTNSRAWARRQALLRVQDRLFESTSRMTSTSSWCWPGGVIPDDLNWDERPGFKRFEQDLPKDPSSEDE